MLEGRTGVVLGVANKRSIAWGIAQRAAQAGADLVLTYQNDRFLKNLQQLVAELPRPPLLLPCDVTEESQIDGLFEAIRSERGHLDFLVHCLAHARREDLEGDFRTVDRDGWRIATEVSAYSFIALARRAAGLMEGRSGSFLTLTYLGSERVVGNYNVMGVAKAALECSVRYLAADLGPLGHRVNAISAGPIKTLAASGVGGFSRILDVVAERAPLRRNVDIAEVGDAGLFFLSDLSRGVTGEVLHVDAGYHAIGL